MRRLQPRWMDDVETSIPREVEDEILRAVAAINYGSVEVVIHGGRVVQIESREKRRFGADARPSGQSQLP